MSRTIKIYCVNTSEYVDVEGGATLAEIAATLSDRLPAPPVCARVNNKTEPLDFAVYQPKMVEFQDATAGSGPRVCVRSLCMMLYRAVCALMPGAKLRIEHSIAKGYFCKLDRPCKDPFDLLDEVERELKIRVRPLAFPISSGDTFKGVYNIYEHNLSLFTTDERQTADAATVDFSDITTPELDKYITHKYAAQLRENLELVECVYDPF